MKIVFISNFFNHHQSEISDNLYKLSKGNFYFIETENIPDSRLKLGYSEIKKNYVKKSYLSESSYNECLKLINEADAVIIGSASYKFIKDRIKNNKIVLKYSERFLKNKKKYFELPLRTIKYIHEGGLKSNVYLLCASAYASSDYKKTFTYINRAFKWGYFPKTPKFKNLDDIIMKKEKNSILWVGRLISWKHPELIIKIAEYLKKDGISFHINIVGDGPLKNKLQQMIFNKNVDNEVKIIGSVASSEVQKYMEKSQIFITTSDQNEGWGAVVNEAMGNACVVIASTKMGAVPYLIKDNYNGIAININDFSNMYKKIKNTILDNKNMKNLAKNAYRSINNEWNAEIAAKRLIELINCIMNDDKIKYQNNGPLSKA